MSWPPLQVPVTEAPRPGHERFRPFQRGGLIQLQISGLKGFRASASRPAQKKHTHTHTHTHTKKNRKRERETLAAVVSLDLTHPRARFERGGAPLSPAEEEEEDVGTRPWGRPPFGGVMRGGERERERERERDVDNTSNKIPRSTRAWHGDDGCVALSEA